MKIKVIEKWLDNSGGGSSVLKIDVEEFNVKECVEEYFGDYFEEYEDLFEWTENDEYIEVVDRGNGISYTFVKV